MAGKQKNNVLNDFMLFIREQGVVGLAVAFVLGAAAKDVVDALVQGIINPVIAVGVNAESLATETLTIGSGDSAVVLGWGRLSSTLVAFVVVAAVVYFVLNKFMAQLDKKK